MIFKNISEVLNNSCRVIEFSDEQSLLSEIKTSDQRFLCIIKNKKSIRHQNDNVIKLDAGSYLTAIAKNSSDIIILNSTGLRELKSIYRTSEAFSFYQRITPFNILIIFYLFLKHFLVRRVGFNGVYSFRKNNKFLFYFGIQRSKAFNKRTRHYLSPLIKIENFFQSLNEQNIRYCILRWFENLPEIQLGEDIDLLVDDNDLEKLHTFIDSRPGIIPLDIYSKTGKPGSDFQNMPYHILSLSEKSLNEAVLYKNKFKVPSNENYFYLLAYHAVFHKGENSGLRSEKFDLKINNKPDHDYSSYLKKIATEAKINLENYTLESLHSFLESEGFAPPIDTLYKLSIENQYLKNYLTDYKINHKGHSKFEGLVCFVAREKIVELELLDEMVKYIKKEGFTVLRIKFLEEPFKTEFTKHVRGGNWNQGPWPVSGGLPAVVIVALDVYPIEPESADFQLHPGLTNRRIINKIEIRDTINDSLKDRSMWFNGIHSSDNEIQALEYLSLAGLNENEIYDEIKKYKELFITHFPILETLSQYSKRAKVELIDFNGTKAVKKTFKPGCNIFLGNEVRACNLFQNKFPLPKVLETGSNYIITKYIEGGSHFGQRISLSSLKKCLNILRKVHEEGFSLLDFQPGNFMIDKKKNIYLIDFEFLYKYQIKPDFFESYDLVGPPEELDKALVPKYHIPKGVKQFDALWYYQTGVKYSELTRLDNPVLIIISASRRYFFGIKHFVSQALRLAKLVLKKIHSHLP